MADGFALIRNADDLVVATESSADAWEAARRASETLGSLGMQLGADKTEVMSFETGFSFLGEDFGPRYPPALAVDTRAKPEQRTLYVALQGGRVRSASGRVIVESKDSVAVLDVPQTKVSRIMCFGSVGLSAGTRTWAMSNDVDVVFASRRGGYLGCLQGSSRAARVERLKAQLALRPETRLAVARAVVEAKVRKQVVLLQRFGRREHAEVTRSAVSTMRGLLLYLPDCATAAEVMGIEGAAARTYFGALGQLVPPDLSFEVRSRQPPMDVVNAALSSGYTILMGECESALTASGLDSTIGILHSDVDRRPSLALDLLEEFRPLVVDQAVLQLTRARAVTITHGRHEDGKPGVLLTKAGRTAFLDAYERRMQQPTRGALPNFNGSIRRHLYRQAQRLWATIEDPTETWTGLAWR